MMRSTQSPADPALEPASDGALPDAIAQIQQARDKIVHAVIQKAIDEGSYQHAKWLFEFGGITAAGRRPPEDPSSLVRLLLDQLQIPETPEEIAAEFSAHAMP
jgi:hypothetical protein